eukprot:CAMPEP_0180523334 /NCGR_PEP_ID=MMETSP1036_2-20121128/57963_1 /TAXON_ID=632150 /ORGANISM="Azadinium spinosum, Strain 3D9" /LENGTH=33 /DNA_ID= /DNA_START= /DNA_END= /DNA_ORIENTATION=
MPGRMPMPMPIIMWPGTMPMFMPIGLIMAMVLA